MRVGDILESCLYAEDLEDAARFYELVLGLEPFSRVPGRHVFFHCGRRVFLLFAPSKTAEVSGDVPPHGAFGAGHVAFAIPEADLSSWRDRLDRCGIAIEAEVAWPGGGISLYVRDPAGNSVELTTPRIWKIDEESFFGGAEGR